MLNWGNQGSFHCQQPEVLILNKVDPCVHDVNSVFKSIPNHSSNFAILADSSDTRWGILLLKCISPHAHLLGIQKWPLHTFVVTSGYFSYCCLSVISVCSFFSDLWHQPGILPQRTEAHRIGPFFQTILCKVQTFKIDVWENPSRSAVCEILGPACLTSKTMSFSTK